MSDPVQLFDDFRSALNAELRALGCKWHVAARDPGSEEAMMLLAADGSELGWVPDHADAPVIAAFERIVTTVQG